MTQASGFDLEYRNQELIDFFGLKLIFREELRPNAIEGSKVYLVEKEKLYVVKFDVEKNILRESRALKDLEGLDGVTQLVEVDVVDGIGYLLKTYEGSTLKNFNHRMLTGRMVRQFVDYQFIRMILQYEEIMHLILISMQFILLLMMA